MIISQTALGLEQNETHKPAYFGETMPSPLSLAASIPSVGPNTLSGASQGLYPSSDGYYLPGRVQADMPNINMYASQSDALVISSPGNYLPNPASVTAAPGLMSSHYATSGLQHPPLYPTLGDDYDMRSTVGKVWHGNYAQPPPSCYPYDNNFTNQYPYDRYCGMDINDGVRRKNATRESTNTLKAWLQEHKKNPYPTKGEKIMLAIITKMTLTQVSTWFANARRRLKKENKMTWVPKNRSSDSNNNSNSKKGEDDDDDDFSQDSQDNDCKSDVEQSVDSDDSDARKVTSTNSNDEISTTSDFKPRSEFSNDHSSITSDQTKLPEASTFVTRPNENLLQSNYSSYDNKEKTWSSMQENLERKPSAEMLGHTLSGVTSPYSNKSYPTPQVSSRESTSLASSSIKKAEVSVQNDSKYTGHGWTANPYHYPSDVAHTVQQMLPEQSEIESMHSRSPTTDGDIKSTVLLHNIAMNSKADSCASTPENSSSYVFGYPEQQQAFLHSIDYYRQMERSNSEVNPYYSHIDSTGQVDIKPEHVPGSFSSNKIQSKPSTLPPLTAPSLSNVDSLSPNHPYQPNLMSPTYYSNMNLMKSSAPPPASYGSSFYQQENFHQMQLNVSSQNHEYYQRKSMYNPENSNFHSPSGSPRK